MMFVLTAQLIVVRSCYSLLRDQTAGDTRGHRDAVTPREREATSQSLVMTYTHIIEKQDNET